MAASIGRINLQNVILILPVIGKIGNKDIILKHNTVTE